MTDDERIEILHRHVTELSELFDAVQIVGSFLTPEGTTRCQKSGSGNWYARQAMCREFVEENFTRQQAESIAEELEPPEEFSL